MKFEYVDEDGRVGFTEDMYKYKNEILSSLKNRHDIDRFNGFLNFIKSKNEMDDFSKVVYFKSSNKVDVICKKHGIYKISPNNYISNHRCYVCKNNQLTVEEFENEIKNKFKTIKLLSKFVNLITDVKIKCTNCGKIRYILPYKLLKMKYGCKCLYGGEKHTTIDYKNKLSKNIICLEEYINNCTPIKHKCKICGYEWLLRPAHALKIKNCPKCSRKLESENRRRSVVEINKSSNLKLKKITCLEYNSLKNKCKFLCNVCNNVWFARGGSVINGKCGCPNCNSTSIGEYQVKNWLDEHNIKYEREYKFKDCKNKKSLPFDFYIPKYNILIEYQGQQHYNHVKFCNMTDDDSLKYFDYRIRLDNIKRSYALENGYTFIDIPYNKSVDETLSNVFKYLI